MRTSMPVLLGAPRARFLGSALCAASLLFGSGATAQDHMTRPVPLPAFSRGMVGNDDSTALVQNPANLAYLPSLELRWTGAFLDEEVHATSQGHAVGVAVPLGFLPIATGVRLDMVNPTLSSTERTLGRSYNYQWFTWGLAVGSQTASIGFAYQRSYSNAPELHGMGSWTLGVNLRPSDYLGIGGVIYNLNRPVSDSGFALGPTFELGLAVRPTGTDALELSVENSFVDDDGGYWVPRAVVDVGVPHLGRVRGDVSWLDPTGDNPSWVASASLVLAGNTRHGSGEASLGARFGEGMSAASERPYANMHTEVAFRAYRETHAADNTEFALRVRLEKTPDVRGHVSLLRKLWKMADDEPNLRAVLLELRSSPARSLAHVQELQDAILHLRERGKKVVCHLENSSGSGLYLCSAADKILINPAGGIRYAGLASGSFYLKDLLTKLGLHADFVRIGKHKSAPEMLSRTGGSPTTVSDRAQLIQQVELELSGGISRGRGISVETLRRTVENGPFTASEAKQAKLVDDYAFDDMLEDKTKELVGEHLIFEKGSRAPTRNKRFGPQKRLAIVYVEGDMVDGRSQTYPILDIHTAGSYTIAESLKKVREDPSVGAVVLRIETGGGSAMAADVIWREVELTARKKPVVVSMGSAAASGGYYIASPGSFVYANPLTITGSIGIFYGKLDAAQLLSKVGVNVETLRTAQHADAQSLFRPYSDEERELLKRKVEQFYSLFVGRVAHGRDMTKAQVDKVGRGRVWTGRQAKGLGLVDELGGLRQALAKARVLGEVQDDADIVELPVRKRSLASRLLGVPGIHAEARGQRPPMPPELMAAVRAVAPYALYPDTLPLARVENLPELMP